MISRFAEWVARHAGWVVGIALALSLMALPALVDLHTGRPTVTIDPSIDALLPAQNAERRFFERTARTFGDDQSILVVLQAEDIFSLNTLARVKRLTEQLQALKGIHRVISLTNVPNLRAEGDAVSLNAYNRIKQPDTEDVRHLREGIRENPLYRNSLLSEDGRSTAVIVYPDDLSDAEFQARGLADEIRRIAEDHAPGPVWLTGPPIIKAATSQTLVGELRFTLPVITGLVALFLLLAFRSLRAVVLPVATIVIALIWTLATMAVFGRSLNLITTLVPPVIITLGLAYAMHMLSAYYAEPERGDGKRRLHRVRESLNEVCLPLVVTGATTAAGFLALLLNPVAAIREFAWLSALGVVYTVLLTLTFLPAALRLAGSLREKRPPGVRFFRYAAVKLARFDVAYRRWILIGGVALMVVGLLLALRIDVGTQYIRGFDEDAQVRVDYEAINRAMGGANPLSIVIQANLEDAFVEPRNLQAVAGLQAWLEDQPEIADSVSMVDQLKLINRSLNDGEQAHFAIPEDARAIKQLLVFGGGDELQRFVDSQFSIARIALRSSVTDSGAVAELVMRIRQRLQQLPPGLAGEITGTSVMVSSTVNAIARGQLQTIGGALLAVFLMLAALFTSFRVGFLVLLPNILPIAVYFGALGLSGVSLNPATSLIAAITLGIAVDDTIHYLARFNRDARRLASEARATVSALTGVIRPVTYTTVALVAGFLVLTASDLQNQQQFGALAAFTLAIAWLTDVTFTPALASGVRIVTLWDVLRLDLGENPQETIPLFDGLSSRQARIFALMSNMETFSQGQRVLTEGDLAGDIYVVIDGRLMAWVDREGKQVELSTMLRGAVMGEVGHFAKRRTANVNAETDVRLLRFDSEDLEGLRKRYPRIAALVFRNLNRVQAERLAQNIHMLR